MDYIGINLIGILSHLSNWKFHAMGLKSKLIELENGSSIRCWVPEGSRHSHKPNLLLIHGFGGDGTLSWWYQIPYLIKDFALYIPDLLFFGESYTKSKERSEIFQAQCLLQVLELEGIQEVPVMGTSYGGFVTFHMAYLAPHLVKKVVIASSGICIDQSSNDQLLLETKCSDISDVLLPCDKVVSAWDWGICRIWSNHEGLRLQNEVDAITNKSIMQRTMQSVAPNVEIKSFRRFWLKSSGPAGTMIFYFRGGVDIYKSSQSMGTSSDMLGDIWGWFSSDCAMRLA